MINSTANPRKIEQFDSDMVHVNNQGTISTATAGTTTNIDIKLTDDHCLTGGTLRTYGSVFGDYVIFQVVDVDNILGYGAGAVLGQYCTKWYMRSDAQEQINENTHYPAKIPAGLYLRITYVSIGTTDVQVAIMYRLHKLMY